MTDLPKFTAFPGNFGQQNLCAALTGFGFVSGAFADRHLALNCPPTPRAKELLKWIAGTI